MARNYQRKTNLFLGGVVIVLAGVLGYLFWSVNAPVALTSPTAPGVDPEVAYVGPPRGRTVGNLSTVWDPLPKRFAQQLSSTTDSAGSNIHPQDYVGPDACEKCHQKNYEAWSKHPHRWMNALASDSTVVGDFGEASIRYRGGKARFFVKNGQRHMSYVRDDLKREYVVTQTIGSRFFQYYVGKGVVGPEVKGHAFYSVDQLLPFGYWMDRKAWVPVVHIFKEGPDEERWDPLEDLVHPSDVEPSAELAQSSMPSSGRGVGVTGHGQLTGQYSVLCNYCHTTFPLGDMFVRLPEATSTTHGTDWFLTYSDYLSEARPAIWDGSRPTNHVSNTELGMLVNEVSCMDAPDNAVTLGVSCEACHLGCREHAKDGKTKASFLPHSPHLLSSKDVQSLKDGRTHANLNWVCKRCHSGDRPRYAAGMATWNSTEYSDAMVGSCYSQLTCVECHDPHQATGKKWSRSAAQDDETCLKCHEAFRSEDRLTQHTHHPISSEGSRCMNCHMPRINEGMQDVVRTHAIFSPNNTKMIEQNQPNACNLCHLDQPIDWTIKHLSDWYGTSFAEEQLNQNYKDRSQPVGTNWLNQKHEATRLVAVEALTKSDSRWALNSIIQMLDDDYVLNRQFTQKGLESMLSIELDQDFGYWFYMSREERQKPLTQIRERLLKKALAD